MTTTVRFTLCLTLLPVVSALAACATPQAGPLAAPRAVRTVAAEAVAPSRGARYAVAVEPAARVTLAVKAAGYVAALHQVRGDDGRQRTLQPGDAVRAGTVLVRLHDADYRARWRDADARVREADSGLVRARLELDRARTLFAAESLTTPELEAAQAGFDGAAARTMAAQAQLEAARLALADCVLVAPADGVVLERPLEVGVLAAVGTAAVVLGDLRDVKAVFGVPDAVVARMVPGEPLGMTSEAFPGERFDGRVTAVAPSADRESRVFAIEVTLANRGGRLRPGMIGAIELAAPTGPADRPAGVAVPIGAVVRASDGSNGYGVFVVESRDGGQVVRARPVRLGPDVGNTVVVIEGLRAGDRVVSTGAALLTDGEAVRVIP